MKILFYLTVLVAAASAQAQIKGPSSIDGWLMHLGSHTEYYKEIQSDASGKLRTFEFNPVIGAGFNIPLADNWKFLPEMSWVLPKFNDDSRIIKNIFLFRADFAYTILDWMWFRFGSSVTVLNQHGRGGKAIRSNGNETAEFYYPDQNRSSINNTLDLGLEFLYESWSLRLQTYTYKIFKEESRQISYSLLINHYWDL